MGAPVHRPGRRGRGGDRVPAARTSRTARVATAAGSLAAAAGLGAAAALDAESRAPVLAGACAAILFLGLGLSTRRPAAIPIALLLLGALLVIPDGDRSIATVIYGSGLLLTAELAYWSLDEHGRRHVEPGVFAPRLLAILTVVAAGMLASVVVYVAADVDISRSATSTAAGATAIVACIALLAAMARRRVMT